LSLVVGLFGYTALSYRHIVLCTSPYHSYSALYTRL
jgi:hypothetical protein